jgi:VPDSG-CTERM motif
MCEVLTQSLHINSMKTKTVVSRLALLVIAITAAFVTQPVFGIPMDHQLVFTENSSTSLTVTFDGSTSGITVTELGPDRWTIALPFGIAGLHQAQWVEPENSNAVNFVQDTGLSGNGFFHVFSGTTKASLPLTVNGMSVPFGTDASDGIAIAATFNDTGDVEAVPDTGTTGSLLGLSLTGLAFFRRKLCPPSH